MILANYGKDFLKIRQDSSGLARLSQDVLNELYGKGYLEAAFKIFNKDSIYAIHWVVGEKYQWATLSPGNVPEYMLSKIGYRTKLYSNEPFNPDQLSKLLNSIIKESENNGRPFASIKLDSLSIIDETFYATLNYDSGPEILFDDMSILGTTKVKQKWLASHLAIRSDQAYNQKLVDKIPATIEQLNYVSLMGIPTVIFKNSRAEVVIELADNQANSIDGIVGFLPNEQEDGKLLVTGQVYLGLSNLFNSGKSLNLEWQSLRPRTQLLDLQYRHPNVFRSNFDFKGNFYLFKEDSIFLNRSTQLTISYNNYRSELGAFYRNNSSTTLTTNTEVENINDLKVNYYGLTYAYRFNSTFNTAKTGLFIYGEGAIGNKEIERITLSTSTQYALKADIKAQIQISKVFSVYNGLMAGQLINNDLLRNDLFRLGGLKSIRGFNENFFFAEKYFINKTELRLYYQPNSYLFLFYDQGVLDYELTGEQYNDSPLGIGGGIALKLKGGLLNLAYGLGKSNDQDFDTRLSKFHFGYIARF
ncbi:MAG: ShlB/FhaC/HecB family hemolysin secretion/activation protein [Fulvivirga sp.]|uniref:ShlB/FhaC/HecB family hemolysin secretion/activation protein n=1 Tax=Fulvivirga sp. TaxID=1931237 RepID=UPI0032EFBBAA